jgi:hypothetical protein
MSGRLRSAVTAGPFGPIFFDFPERGWLIAPAAGFARPSP